MNKQFATDYAKIRAADGHGEVIAQNFERLPYVARDSLHAHIWAMRSRSYETLVQHVLPQFGEALRILDLGAGIGWLSARLSGFGHQPCAVDICIEGIDGLAAAGPFNPTWTRVQADFDHLPFTAATFDVAIFNGSFHYSRDYAVTIAEAARVIKPRGGIVVMDSPLYQSAASGEAMAAEMRASLRERYSVEPIPCRQFLCWTELKELGRNAGLTWRTFRPRYAMRNALRPWLAAACGRREPASFAVLVASQMK